jgi:O-antigen/teichoic acid export membrane protein
MAHSTAHSTVSRIERLSQRRRRVLAVATLAGLPAMFVWSTFWMGTSVPNVAWGPISFALIGMTVVGSFVLYRYVRDRADMPGRRLDEREKELRDRAWILSYQVLSAVVVAAVIVIGFAVFVLGHAVTLDANLVNAIVLSVAVLLPILPAAALAWIEPDPVEEA